MRRVVLWALSTLSAVVLLFSYHTSTAGSMSAGTSVHSQQAVASGSGSSSGSSGKSSGSSSSTKTGSSAHTVTGAVASTEWGPVQVELTVDGGTITKVSVVQYPSGNGKDDEINSYALPILTSETIDAQSASIDMVSGATVTSGGYLQSLQSALDQANL
jgi:uncharacterized protein with FMN-binding domain